MSSLLVITNFRTFSNNVKNQINEEDYQSIESEINDFLNCCKIVQNFVKDTFNLLFSKNNILIEGAQGTLLDIDHGTYPFVTSSSPFSGGISTGLGVPLTKLEKIIGIFKAYTTRVGSGPFPTELKDSIGEHLGNVGNEFGSTTGRARRCGWIDLPALKYAININGVTKLNMMKSDVLSGIDKIKVCTHYILDNNKIDYLPFEDNNKLIPVYKEMKGWKEDISQINNLDQAPKELHKYIEYLEKELNTPISIISVGPDRKQTFFR